MERIYLGIKGNVVCINSSDGSEQWRTELKSTSGVTTLMAQPPNLYAYSGGHLFCVDIESGAIKWCNKLSGLGYGPCVLAGDNADLVQLAATQQAAMVGATVAATSVATSSGTS